MRVKAPMPEHISFEEYRERYNTTGILLSGRYLKRPAKPLNGNQLRTQYEAHIRKLERIESGKAESASDITKDQIIRQECQKRDRNRCRLMGILTYNEMRELVNNSIPLLLHKLDCAHVFGKNAYPKMRFIVDNVVLLNRVSHGWLDVGKSPINGKPITVEEKRIWWERIVGKKIYGRLFQMSREEIDASEK
jgi:hypothetical protein